MIFINFFFSKQKKRWIASRKSLFEFKIRNSKRDFVTKFSEIANGYPKPNDSNRTFIVIENCFETFSLLLPSLIWSDFHFLQCFLFIGALIRNYFVLVIGKKKDFEWLMRSFLLLLLSLMVNVCGWALQSNLESLHYGSILPPELKWLFSIECYRIVFFFSPRSSNKN